ncbi:cytochrome P450-like protein 15 [Sarcoptes scabiei]|uniref:Cytochrome P450-like protein 15 n=1 Tax=Sarcoptes scabiei TaxID=52283 RepID=A0A132A524_SARSC|nr:cytochrome P450-like protein 15 [Sarcoptes scabiei]
MFSRPFSRVVLSESITSDFTNCFRKAFRLNRIGNGTGCLSNRLIENTKTITNILMNNTGHSLLNDPNNKQHRQSSSLSISTMTPSSKPSTIEVNSNEKLSHSKCPYHQQSSSQFDKNSRPASLLRDGVYETIRSFKEIPSPQGLPIFGTLFDLIKAGGAEYVHQYCDKRHRMLGPIFREKLGNVEAVFVSDANLVQKIYQNEGKYPRHMVPEPWIIYNQNKGVQRGLFFMEGEEWSQRRSELNKVFLKSDVIDQYANVFNQIVSDVLDIWSTRLNRIDGDNILSSIIALGTMIFGRRLGCIANISQNASPNIHEFVHCVQQIFIESANMQLIPAKLANLLRLPMWNRFEIAAGKALDLANQYVEENAKQIDIKCQQNGGIIQQIFKNSEIKLDEISRIVVDLFIAAADTVRFRMLFFDDNLIRKKNRFNFDLFPFSIF